MALFSVLTDLFRDHTTNGWVKAIWVLFLVFLPFLTVLVYLIARGRGMNERAQQAAASQQKAAESYIRDVAGNSPTDQIEKAHQLLNAGAISQEEFDKLKSNALA
ncbi:MAG: SHOCT domain-containing protein [Microbacteriaceae bacterium]|nr:SHOCT domain-containing protein [Microbacteriaceae bacterium]